MAEDPHVVSISSNPSIGPDDLARKTFPAARRGVDGDAVRTYLAAVANEMRDQADREAQLRRLLADAERRAENPEIDEAMLSRHIGAETAKILQSAHEAANDLVTRAEARAGELIAEAESVYQELTERAESEAAELRSLTEQDTAALVEQTNADAAALSEAAQAESDRLLDQARADAAALIEGAQADAVALLDATTEECRRMVSQARDLRNRVLADLAERRRAAHVQLEQLRTGKDSLVGVVEAVAVTVDDLRERLATAEDEARLAATEAGQRAALEDELDDLGPLEAELAAAAAESAADGAADAEELASDAGTVGEADGVAPARRTSRRSVDELFARIRASRAAEEAADAAGAGSPDGGEGAVAADIEAEESLEDDRLEQAAEAAIVADVVAEALAADRSSIAPVPAGGGPASGDGESAETDLDETIAVAAAVAVAVEEAVEDVVAVTAPVIADELVAEGVPELEAEAAAEDLAEELATEVVEEAIVEALLEGASEVAEADPSPSSVAAEGDELIEPDVEALARRDTLLDPVVARLARSVKRALQDDQNELLDALRQVSGAVRLDDVLPANAQRERFVTASEEALAAAYTAGAAFLVEGDSHEGPSVVASLPDKQAALTAARLIAAQLADDLTSLLRQRIERSLEDLGSSGEGASDAAGATYREWRGSRVESLAGDFATRAFGAGELDVLAGLDEGDRPLVRWAVEDEGASGSCAECDDNALAGYLPPGEEFATGHPQPPVHPGCRCLLVPVRS